MEGKKGHKKKTNMENDIFLCIINSFFTVADIGIENFRAQRKQDFT